jgi:hypothetical protein
MALTGNWHLLSHHRFASLAARRSPLSFNRKLSEKADCRFPAIGFLKTIQIFNRRQSVQRCRRRNRELVSFHFIVETSRAAGKALLETDVVKEIRLGQRKSGRECENPFLHALELAAKPRVRRVAFELPLNAAAIRFDDPARRQIDDRHVEDELRLQVSDHLRVIHIHTNIENLALFNDADRFPVRIRDKCVFDAKLERSGNRGAIRGDHGDIHIGLAAHPDSDMISWHNSFSPDIKVEQLPFIMKGMNEWIIPSWP